MKSRLQDAIYRHRCRRAHTPHTLHHATARLSKVMHQLHDLMHRTALVEHQLKTEVGAVNAATAALNELNMRQTDSKS